MALPARPVAARNGLEPFLNPLCAGVALAPRWLSKPVRRACVARFAEAVKPVPRQLRDQQAQTLQALVVRLWQMIRILAIEKTRLHAARESVHAHTRDHIAWLESRVKGLNQELERSVQNSPVWRVKEHLLRSVHGGGGRLHPPGPGPGAGRSAQRAVDVPQPEPELSSLS